LDGRGFAPPRREGGRPNLALLSPSFPSMKIKSLLKEAQSNLKFFAALSSHHEKNFSSLFMII
jgi:hypothetical protein